MHALRLIHQLARQGDHLTQHELGDAACVAERSVEDDHATLGRRLESHLVRANAKTTDREQPAPRVDDLWSDARFAADAEQMNVFDLVAQLALTEGSALHLDREPILAHHLCGARVNVLEEQHLDALLGVARDVGHEMLRYSWGGALPLVVSLGKGAGSRPAGG